MIAPARRRDDERGLMVILFTLAMTVILVFAALVLDVAQLRTDRRGGAAIDWLAPNVITERRPTPAELVANPFEDLALWTEAGGSDSPVGGNANTNLAGVYFLPNADEFTLAGGAGLDVSLSAQFIARRMRVTGGAAVNLVPNPYDAVALPERNLLLVR